MLTVRPIAHADGHWFVAEKEAESGRGEPFLHLKKRITPSYCCWECCQCPREGSANSRSAKSRLEETNCGSGACSSHTAHMLEKHLCVPLQVAIHFSASLIPFTPCIHFSLLENCAHFQYIGSKRLATFKRWGSTLFLYWLIGRGWTWRRKWRQGNVQTKNILYLAFNILPERLYHRAFPPQV